MDGGLSFLTILEVEVEAAVGVVVALAVLIWSAMSVASLVILPVNVDYVVVQEDVVAAALDTAGVQVMEEGNFTDSDGDFLGCIFILLSYIIYILDFDCYLPYVWCNSFYDSYERER